MLGKKERSVDFANEAVVDFYFLLTASVLALDSFVDAEKWIALMKQYVNPVELTAELLNTLIEKITVHEAVKGEDGSREQEVEIYYRFIGKID